jgi:hypothetical protein
MKGLIPFCHTVDTFEYAYMNARVCVNMIVVCVLVKTATKVEWGVELAELYYIPVLSSVQDMKKPC